MKYVCTLHNELDTQHGAKYWLYRTSEHLTSINGSKHARYKRQVKRKPFELKLSVHSLALVRSGWQGKVLWKQFVKCLWLITIIGSTKSTFHERDLSFFLIITQFLQTKKLAQIKQRLNNFYSTKKQMKIDKHYRLHRSSSIGKVVFFYQHLHCNMWNFSYMSTSFDSESI